MQAAGGLRKRRRRNIAKAKASGVILYADEADKFDPYALRPGYQSDHHYENRQDQRSYAYYHNELDGFHYNGRSRVTRDPQFSSRDVPTKNIEDGPPSPRSAWSEEDQIPRHKNPALLSANHIARLRHIMILGIASITFPWRWNKETHQIELWSPGWVKIWKVMWTLSVIQSTGITCFQFYAFFSRINTDESGSWRPVFMSSFAVLWYLYNLSLNCCMYYYGEAMRYYINSMFDMNKKLVDEFLITTDGHKEGGQILLNLSIPTNISQAFVSISLFLTFPNSPWYLYHYIYSPNHGWWWLIPGALQEFVFAGQVLTVYLLVAWILVAHANSVGFWLQEAHKLNDSGMTRDELREPHNSLKLYRSFQVLTTTFNGAMSVGIPVVKAVSWTALIPCGFVLIRSMDGKFMNEIPGILTYPLGVVDCFSCPFGMLQMGARMYDISASFLTSWSQTKHQSLRKILISCPILKVKIGRLYVITTSTTITYFKSALDYIINAIVTFP